MKYVTVDCEKDKVYNMRAETRKQNVTLFDLSWEHVLGDSDFSPFVHVYK